jgi:hypothetical protein
MILHAQEYDNMLETAYLPEILSRLAAIYELETEKALKIDVLERLVKYDKKYIKVIHFFTAPRPNVGSMGGVAV